MKISGTEILRGFSMIVRKGEMVSVTGRNGAGKTTLIRAIMGLSPAASGQIEIRKEDFTRRPAHDRATAGVGYMPEDRGLVPQFTVRENVLVPGWALRLTDIEKRFDRICGLIPEISEMRDRKASSLSGGQQKFVALGRALLPAESLLLLDEPFEGVSPKLSRRLAEVLFKLKSERLAVVISQSEDKHSADLFAREYRIERGANVMSQHPNVK
ncbi:MAG: ATP-binding cassette domain-containing protein [Afipia sp.]|nr:ATP-binding cassette domain-containing protein [Afipia sp.]